MNEEKITTSDNKKLSPEEIKRVKGLGCLQDKRYDDIFNIRVITGNGHITTDEHRAIADAADKDRKSTRLNSSHIPLSRMPSSA